MMKFQRLFMALIMMLTIQACKKGKEAEGIDAEMLDLAKSSSGFTWYRFSADLLNKSSGTGHSEALIRTRYNAIAAGSLDSTGRVKEGITFPEGSLIVKELYENANKLNLYAIQLKRSAAAEADASGWVWGYINADGSVREPASKKGQGCRGCHSQGGNIDLTLMNAYFP